ncbi:MAG: hypothetical protein WAM79_24000 [Candidatus Sulfotelmatobacter sp.]
MSAELWDIGEVEPVAEAGEPHLRAAKPQLAWNPGRFAQEQIRGLVRQVFCLQRPRPVRQVVFSAIEGRTDVRSVCKRVGEVLAGETRGSVALAGSQPGIVKCEEQGFEVEGRNEHLRKNASALGGNLWLLPGRENSGAQEGVASVHTYLGQIRKEFEYSIVECRPAGECDEALEMAQFADGIILVISAEYTRRYTARKVIEALHAAQVRILGTVLSDREFPMPERLYHWL